jgi:hypothetical protein
MKFNFAHACVQKTKNTTKDESSFQIRIENKMIHKFRNFKMKIFKLSTRQLVKFPKFQVLLLLF